MIYPRIMSNYILVKKSTLWIGGLIAAGLAACYFYKHHRSELKKDLEQFTDDVADTAQDVAKKGTRKVKEIVDEVKS